MISAHCENAPEVELQDIKIWAGRLLCDFRDNIMWQSSGNDHQLVIITKKCDILYTLLNASVKTQNILESAITFQPLTCDFYSP